MARWWRLLMIFQPSPSVKDSNVVEVLLNNDFRVFRRYEHFPLLIFFKSILSRRNWPGGGEF